MTYTPTDSSLATGFPAAEESAWRALVEKALKGSDFERRLVARSADGIGIGPLYTRASAGETALAETPGAAPYTRGFATAEQTRWQIRQLHAVADGPAATEAIGEDRAAGADAITLRIAGPGQNGVPARADVLAGIIASATGLAVHLEPGAAAAEAAAAVAGVVGVAGLGIDPVGTLARSGETIYLAAGGTSGFAIAPPWLAPPGLTLVADGRPFHEAGGSEGQELAGLLGALVCYLRAAEAGGLGPGDALPRIGLALAADADIFLTIAKLRAARRLVWRIADACGAGAAAGQLRLDVTTSERMMSRRDPWVNMLRTTAAAAAAAMGGADAIGVLPYSWALGRPDSFARRIARNTHHVLAEESGLGRVADPAGGAWSVERLTGELAAKAWAIFQDWEAAGGIVAALRSGQVRDQIGAVAEARAKAIATGRQSLTGTSAFPLLGADGITVAPWPSVPPCRGGLLSAIRLAAPFERLRDAADRAAVKPEVFLAALGPRAEHASRATWVQNLLAAGGIASIPGEGFTASADAGRAYAESGARIACICGSEEAYGQLGEAVAGVIKQAGAQRVYLAGRPANAAQLQAAGVDGFWFAGADMLAILSEVHDALGLGH